VAGQRLGNGLTRPLDAGCGDGRGARSRGCGGGPDLGPSGRAFTAVEVCEFIDQRYLGGVKTLYLSGDFALLQQNM